MTVSSFPSILLCFCLIVTLSCDRSQPDKGLQPGDLLFQDLNCGDLCDAIEAVTEGVNGKDFSHCAMVVSVNDTLTVVEAIGNSVRFTSIPSFFARSGDTLSIQRITVARVKEPFKPLIEGAAAFATQQIGQPYDPDYLMDNGKWYCSELLYEAFKDANGGQSLFELNPMTFKDPETQAFFPAWVEYYAQLGSEIPEGEPGLNPGSISRSDKLEIIPFNKFTWQQHQ